MARGRKTGGKDFRPGHDKPGPGRPSYPEDIKRASKLTRTVFEAKLNRFLFMNNEELKTVLEDKEAPILDQIVGRILLRAVKDGDHTRFDFILNRLLGKITEHKEEVKIEPFIIESFDGMRRIELGVKQVINND